MKEQSKNQRKVVRTGVSTLTVSLPSKWARAHNIKNGQLINIETSKGKLVLSVGDIPPEPIELNFSDEEEWYVGKILRHLYVAGYDEIIIKYKNPGILSKIRKNLEILAGMEVVESTSSECKIRNVLQTIDSDYDKTVEKAMRLLSSQLDYFIEDCENGSLEMKEEVKELHLTFARLCNVCRRLISKKSLYDSIHSRYASEFFNSLIEISLLIKYCYYELESKKSSGLSDEELKLLLKIKEFYKSLVSSYNKKDIVLVREVLEERQKMFDEVLGLLNGENPVLVHYFLMMLRNLTPIANHITMNQVMR